MDGVDVKDYPRGALRRKIVVVPQKAALFQGSIRANMKWGRDDATDKDIWEALTIAQAKEIVEKKTASWISIWSRTAGTSPAVRDSVSPSPVPS